MVMWLSGLHAPESFLTALVQIACRKNGWTLERSTSYTRVTTYMDVDDVDKRPDQVRIYIPLLLVLHTISTALEIDFCWSLYLKLCITGTALVSLRRVAREDRQRCRVMTRRYGNVASVYVQGRTVYFEIKTFLNQVVVGWSHESWCAGLDSTR